MLANNIARENLKVATDRLRDLYQARNPGSKELAANAASSMPGGNTRSVLFYEPFPLVIESGAGAEVVDVDGHRYHDFIGEMSAGLYGHSDPIISAAIIEALGKGTVLAAPNRHESQLAEAIKQRFSSIELLRFCNSGTEANILALMTARYVTGKSKVMVFDGAYHGGVLVFANGGMPINLPFEYVVAPYNDAQVAADLIREHADKLACVIVEPILGAAGNIPGEIEFLTELRAVTHSTGVLLIFDEVKTSRCGSGGVQGLMSIKPDLTTLGKYLGGGLSAGAFGGRRDIMDVYNPFRKDSLKHAGTFNNNVCSMAGGLAGLTKVFTAARAAAFHSTSEGLRTELNDIMERKGVPVQFLGVGSFFTLHLGRRKISRAADVPLVSREVGALFHMFGLLENLIVAARGDLYLSLPMTSLHHEKVKTVASAFADQYGVLIGQLADEHGLL